MVNPDKQSFTLAVKAFLFDVDEVGVQLREALKNFEAKEISLDALLVEFERRINYIQHLMIKAKATIRHQNRRLKSLDALQSGDATGFESRSLK